jgi:hypothetical protein
MNRREFLMRLIPCAAVALALSCTAANAATDIDLFFPARYRASWHSRCSG